MQIIQSKLLKKFSGITHCFTTKDDGNLAFHVGDDEMLVLQNHNSLAKKLAYARQRLIHMKQIHSSEVHIVSADDNFSNPHECDALITDKKNTPLMVMVADCSPILFYDNNKSVIAVAHAGRQGAFKNIVQNVIDSFVGEYNSNISDINAAVGASIGECCYEVSSEINLEAKELNLEYAMTKKGDSFYLNVSKILTKQLLNAGLKKENIEISQECSSCKKKKYFSYRAEGITGRFSGVLLLK